MKNDLIKIIEDKNCHLVSKCQLVSTSKKASGIEVSYSTRALGGLCIFYSGRTLISPHQKCGIQVTSNPQSILKAPCLARSCKALALHHAGRMPYIKFGAWNPNLEGKSKINLYDAQNDVMHEQYLMGGPNWLRAF
jgi:hypothetical protein